VQEEDADADSDPATSEGIFVGLTSSATALPPVGAKVRVTGTVKDGQAAPAFGQTRIETSSFTTEATGQTLPTAVTIDPTPAAGDTPGRKPTPPRGSSEPREGGGARGGGGGAGGGAPNKSGELFRGRGPARGPLRPPAPAAPDLIGTVADAGAGNPANP